MLFQKGETSAATDTLRNSGKDGRRAELGKQYEKLSSAE